uniref:Uncharacterized protein n=1 Tax=Oryza glumipatula TaxID=40148 RepID=A0A0D9ZA50_9ORYZ
MSSEVDIMVVVDKLEGIAVVIVSVEIEDETIMNKLGYPALADEFQLQVLSSRTIAIVHEARSNKVTTTTMVLSLRDTMAQLIYA